MPRVLNFTIKSLFMEIANVVIITKRQHPLRRNMKLNKNSTDGNTFAYTFGHFPMNAKRFFIITLIVTVYYLRLCY